jgi:hypothetical protein
MRSKCRREPITRTRVDDLVQFLPLLGRSDAELEPKWRGLDAVPDIDGSLPMPHPVYPSIVEEFFNLAGQPWWADYEYMRVMSSSACTRPTSLPRRKFPALGKH